MKLYSYFRSSASYRVRIALGLKGLDYESVAVHLVRNGGEQLGAAFTAINPAQLVPVLEHEGNLLTQSIAIIEYLDELGTGPSLIGESALQRARVRSMALDIACEIHPVNNLRVLKYLTGTLKIDEPTKTKWYRHWVETGLEALEQRLSPDTDFCAGDRPSLVECCLVPQLYNARRFDCDLSRVPRLVAIGERCLELPTFRRAAPERQADAA